VRNGAYGLANQIQSGLRGVHRWLPPALLRFVGGLQPLLREAYVSVAEAEQIDLRSSKPGVPVR
jgi:hypothetical protein